MNFLSFLLLVINFSLNFSDGIYESTETMININSDYRSEGKLNKYFCFKFK